MGVNWANKPFTIVIIFLQQKQPKWTINLDLDVEQQDCKSQPQWWKANRLSTAETFIITATNLHLFMNSVNKPVKDSLLFLDTSWSLSILLVSFLCLFGLKQSKVNLCKNIKYQGLEAEYAQNWECCFENCTIHYWYWVNMVKSEHVQILCKWETIQPMYNHFLVISSRKQIEPYRACICI